jgi:TIR domain
LRADQPHEFDAALSFAGEDRLYAEQLANSLRGAHVKVFYDQFALADIWGQDLVEHLAEIYRSRARFVVMFISKHYARKPYPTHERRSALSREIEAVEPYILPIRLDDTEIPGLLPTISYINWHQHTVVEITHMLMHKLGRAVPIADTATTSSKLRIPITGSELDNLGKDRPYAWEYILFAGSLLEARSKLEPRWFDHQVRYGRVAGPTLNETEVKNYLRNALDEPKRILINFDRLFDGKSTTAAFGRPGEPGNPQAIRYLAQRIVSCYEDLLTWAALTRARHVPEKYVRAIDLLSQFVDRPLQELRTFFDDVVTTVERIPEILASKEAQPVVVKLTCTLTADQAVVDAYIRELRVLRLRR